jgi:tetratricopeptide (TPR) repeat protein
VDGSTLTEQGIAALRSGNKEEGVRLLTEALRQDPNSEEAWLYLGAAVDDPARKRQCFERVLQINPNNERAQNALARLNAETGAPPPTASTAGSAASSGGTRRYAIPASIPGAPASLSVSEAVRDGRARIEQAVQIYARQDYEQIVRAGQTATQWDSVFVIGVAVVITGLAELFGRLIGWPLTLFSGGLATPVWAIIQVVISMAVVAGGFAGAIYLSKFYIDSQHINVPMPQHSMYVAMTFLPVALVSALFTFITQALGFLNCVLFPIIGLASFVAAIYGLYLLWQAMERVYGSENSRGLITAALAFLGYIVVSVVIGAMGGILSGIFWTLFRARTG